MAVFETILGVLTHPVMTGAANVASVANLGIGIATLVETKGARNDIASYSAAINRIESGMATKEDIGCVLGEFDRVHTEIQYASVGTPIAFGPNGQPYRFDTTGFNQVKNQLPVCPVNPAPQQPQQMMPLYPQMYPGQTAQPTQPVMQPIQPAGQQVVQTQPTPTPAPAPNAEKPITATEMKALMDAQAQTIGSAISSAIAGLAAPEIPAQTKQK